MSGFERPDFKGQLTAGVVGWPVNHSKSPLIHRFWLQKSGLDGDYSRLPVDPETAEDAFRNLGKLGFSGVNVTVPLKEVALKVADWADEAATAIGAANVLVVEKGGRLRASNTDWPGFLEPMQRRHFHPKSAVLIGAGGASRAILMALQAYGVEAITIVNRSVARAQEVASLWTNGNVTVVEMAPDLLLPAADLVVNSSSLGMKGQPPLLVDLSAQPDHCYVYDIVYAPLETALLAQARARNLQTIDGLEMLVGQADTAFALFYGVKPPRQYDAELRALLLA